MGSLGRDDQSVTHHVLVITSESDIQTTKKRVGESVATGHQLIMDNTVSFRCRKRCSCLGPKELNEIVPAMRKVHGMSKQSGVISGEAEHRLNVAGIACGYPCLYDLNCLVVIGDGDDTPSHRNCQHQSCENDDDSPRTHKRTTQTRLYVTAVLVGVFGGAYLGLATPDLLLTSLSTTMSLSTVPRRFDISVVARRTTGARDGRIGWSIAPTREVRRRGGRP
jgi:hypothetical protein